MNLQDRRLLKPIDLDATSMPFRPENQMHVEYDVYIQLMRSISLHGGHRIKNAVFQSHIFNMLMGLYVLIGISCGFRTVRIRFVQAVQASDEKKRKDEEEEEQNVEEEGEKDNNNAHETHPLRKP